MNAVVLHQGWISGSDPLEESGQVVNAKFVGDTLKNLLKAGIIGRTEIGRHAYADQQNLYFLSLGELHHLPQVVGALLEAKSPEPVVATKLYDQVSRMMISQQSRQAL